MRPILICALKDLLRILRDPVGLATWLGIPAVVGVAVLSLVGRGGTTPRGVLAVADLDDTFLSAMVTRAYTEGKLAEMITVQKTPLEEGRRLIAAGNVSALLVIPKGFSNQVLNGSAVQLELVTNPAQAIMPGIIQSVTESLADSAWYARRLVGGDLQQFAGLRHSPPESQIADFSVKISRLVTAYRKYVDPPAIDVQTEVHERGAQSINLAHSMFPSMTYLAILFLAFGFGDDLWREKAQGTLRRVLTTSTSLGQFLAGKLLAMSLLLAAVAAIALATGWLGLGISVHHPATLVLWLVLTGDALYLGMLALHTLASTHRAARVMANIAVMVLAMFGGCFFSFDLMPESLARIGRLTPNGWSMVQFTRMMDGETGTAAMAVGCAATAAVAALLFVWAARHIGRTAMA